MSIEPTTAQKLRGLPWAYVLCAANHVFCQLTVFGSIFPLFLDSLGLDKHQVGALLAILPLCGVLSVLVGTWTARWGIKRAFIVCNTVRALVMAAMLFTPLALAWGGAPYAFRFVAVVVLAFAVVRAVGVTAYSSWQQEFVPNSVRGKFTAVANIVVMLAAMAATLLASFLLRAGTDGTIRSYVWLMAIGVAFGLAVSFSAARIPGGQPQNLEPGTAGWRGVLRPMKDRQYLRFVVGFGTWQLGQGLVAFLPLFMKDRIGLDQSSIVLLDVAGQVAVLLVAIPWGWAADRYGSRPVALSSLGLLLLYPVALLLIPRHGGPWSLAAALGAVFLYNTLSLGWQVGVNRMYCNSVVPAEHRTAYISVHQTWMGLFGGLSPLLGGRVLHHFGGLHGDRLGLHADAYLALMVIYAASVLGALLLLRQIRPAGEMPTFSFAGMFFRGDPIGAVGALLSYNAAGDERQRVSTAERLGKARSPLNVQELLECLADPSFNVRFEAILSIAHGRPHPQLTDALLELLEGPEPDLALAGAWALGRLGDRRAIPALREKLTSGYPLLAARCARALAALDDRESLPILLARLHDEVDDGLRIAYAAALGSLGTDVALAELLAFLRDTDSEPVRFELALALARIGGREEELVRLWRRIRRDRETAMAQASDAIHRRLARIGRGQTQVLDLSRRCRDAFDRGDLADGVGLLVQLLHRLPLDRFNPASRLILEEVRQRLAQFGDQRPEYLLLAIDRLDHALGELAAAP